MRWVVAGFLLILLAMVGYFRVVHGGGSYYPSVATEPLLHSEQVRSPISLPYPPGMVTVSTEGRVFFTYHMLHKPERYVDATIFEWVEGQARPFPSQHMQAQFHGAMGITTDRQQRLWVVKPGELEGRPTQLLAIDMNTGEMVLDYTFADGKAGFAQDMRVSPDGQTVYLADTGLFKFTEPSLIVFDVAAQQPRWVLEGHATVSPQDWLMRKTNGEPYKLAWGLLTFTVGVDGIALTPDGQWLYYATMSHDSVYRVATEFLLDPTMTDAGIEPHIERVGTKPMSDGIELLADRSLLVTDVENGGLAVLKPDGSLATLSRDPQVDWADSVSVSPEGDAWFTDSRLTDLIDQFARPADDASMLASGPYAIYQITAQDLAAVLD